MFFFNFSGFLFMFLSMWESINILAILWSAAHHYAQEDVHRSARQKTRITKGAAAGLLCVVFFILPSMIVKFVFNSDFLGRARPLAMAFYQVTSVLLFTWVGLQLYLMFEDGVAATKKPQRFEMKTNTTDTPIQYPPPARVDQKTDLPPEYSVMNSDSANKLFSKEKRGLTYMHFITSSIVYFYFTESHFYIMQFNAESAKAYILPFALSVILSCLMGFVMVYGLNRTSMLRLFLLSFIMILGSAAHVAARASEQLMIFVNLMNQDENKKPHLNSGRIIMVSLITAAAYLLGVGGFILVHRRLIKKT